MMNTNYKVSNNQISKFPSIKSQILLAHTSSTIEEYFTKISTRHHGTYDAPFTYTIDANGIVYNHFSPLHYSNLFNYHDIDSQIISVGLENAGWLKQKTPDQFIDWKGHIYKGEVFEKIWRGYNFWAPYTPEQTQALLDLLGVLIKEYHIEPNFSGKNITLDDPQDFKGVLNRSNYYRCYYDLSPAFNFERITDKIKTI
jgi:hypothetical protein